MSHTLSCANHLRDRLRGWHDRHHTAGVGEMTQVEAVLQRTDRRLRSITSPVPSDVWRRILESDPRSLPEHDPAWLAAMCEVGPFRDVSRLYETRDGRRFVLPLVRRRDLAGVGGCAQSFPSAWGIGGLAGPDLDPLVVRAVCDDLRRSGLQRITIRPDPLQAEIWSAAGLSYAIAVPRRAHVLDLSGGIDAVQARMKSNTRGAIRRAARAGVEVVLDRSGALVDDYYRLYLSSLERWAARQHEPVALARWRGRRRDPRRKLAAMAAHLGERLVIAMAYVDRRPANGSIMLLGATAHVTRSAMDVEAAGNSSPGVLVHRRLLELACSNGCTWYHLGESGTNQRLAQFKQSLGARPYDYAEYRIERLPWTRADAAVTSTVKRLLRFRDS